MPATDLLDNPHADDPTWANTGTGAGFHDRGAVERVQGTGWNAEPLHRTIGAGPLDTKLRANTKYQWTTDGPGGQFAYQYDDSPLWRVSRSSLDVDHRSGGREAPAYGCTSVGATSGPAPHRSTDRRLGPSAAT
ncbi:hypothetical protein C1I99_03470 [Micromonospora deserti]|uniref:Uncharacterized protein n=1 Tax=Micromonospora deserti TaxID=2070366 RepID=A0A2W2CRI8_9ACTN|nr:hypothetical protein C1I99_03470 [Micromonospora deserti]